MATCDARGTLLRHFEDMYGTLGARQAARLVRAERLACDELQARCRRRTLLRDARRAAANVPR